MSQKSSLPQAAKAVSHVLMSDTKEKFRMDITPVELWGRYWQLAEQVGGGPPGDLATNDINRKTGT
jgi:hypothetical protein